MVNGILVFYRQWMPHAYRFEHGSAALSLYRSLGLLASELHPRHLHIRNAQWTCGRRRTATGVPQPSRLLAVSPHFLAQSPRLASNTTFLVPYAASVSSFLAVGASCDSAKCRCTSYVHAGHSDKVICCDAIAFFLLFFTRLDFFSVHLWALAIMPAPCPLAHPTIPEPAVLSPISTSFGMGKASTVSRGRSRSHLQAPHLLARSVDNGYLPLSSRRRRNRNYDSGLRELALDAKRFDAKRFSAGDYCPILLGAAQSILRFAQT